MPITLRDVGEHAGVSAMTVSRVINGREGVDAETQRRVEEAIEALDYVPNRIARGPDLAEDGDDRADRARCSQPVFLTGRARRRNRRRARPATACCYAIAKATSGSSANTSRIWSRTGSKACCWRRQATIRGIVSFRCCAADFPLVLLDRSLPDLDCDLIVSDSASGARRLVEHLIAVGHRDIAHLTDADDTSTGRERLRGYREALAAAGIPYREELVFRTTVDQIGGYRATQQVLALDRLPTAIFTVNNMTVVGAMQALRERGLSVPDDMGLVCFDDVEHLAVLSPFLTVIDQPAETFGSLGAQLLLERISGKAGPRSRRIVLQTDLVVRQSCCFRSGVPSRRPTPK